MRIVMFVTILAAAGYSLLQDAPLDRVFAARSIDEVVAAFEPPDEVAVAMDARCGQLDIRERVSCEEALAARFARGTATPEAVLRLHCTRVGSVWDAPLPKPPTLCADRFGGWVSGQTS